MSSSSPQHEWELAKENYRPIREGRKAADIQSARAPTTQLSVHEPALALQRSKFESELTTSDDPLATYRSYIAWHQVALSRAPENTAKTT